MLTPLLGQQGTLGITGRRDGGRGSRKGGLHRITDGLEVDAPVGPDRRVEQGTVTFDRSRHRLAVSLPALGAALDVGEEEGDSAGGKIGHARFQTLGWMWSLPIVP